MARIDWAQLCELAFLDDRGRLCLIGVTTRLPVPSLPLVVHQLMIAARVVDVQAGDDVDVSVAIYSPRGTSGDLTPHDLDVTVAGGEYLLITLRDLPVCEQGIHQIVVSVGDHAPTALEIPVALVSAARTEIH